MRNESWSIGSQGLAWIAVLSLAFWVPALHAQPIACGQEIPMDPSPACVSSTVAAASLSGALETRDLDVLASNPRQMQLAGTTLTLSAFIGIMVILGLWILVTIHESLWEDSPYPAYRR